MADYIWKPIEPLSDNERNIDLASMRPLYESWRSSKTRLKQNGKLQLQSFNDRLVRRLSVETGILEQLYDLDRGTTEALVAHGFVEELISRSQSNIEPSRLIDILRDQEAAIQLVIDCVAKSRGLSKGLIHELHAIITRHQDTTTALDQFGNRLEIRLLKGRYKTEPNNPRRPGGDIHEYCPPIHVDSEMDNLLGWFATYSDEDPIIAASWLHHRFTQIHPYQDGNGRLSRVLTTLVLLRAQLLPLVVDRDMRSQYIGALEQADSGDLTKLADLFARLERTAIVQALSVDFEADDNQQSALSSAVIESLSAKFGKKKQTKFAELRNVNQLALSLRSIACHDLRASLTELTTSLGNIVDAKTFVVEGGSDKGNAHWYKQQVVKTARESSKYVNFTEDHYFTKASISVEQDRVVFISSFHHIGRELSGLMEVSAFAAIESIGDTDTGAGVEDFIVCSLDPFVFTYKTQIEDIREAFGRWLDAAFAIGLKEFGDRI